MIRSISNATFFLLIIFRAAVCAEEPSKRESSEEIVERLFNQMKDKAGEFDPMPLLKLRDAGMRGLMDKLFPETVVRKKDKLVEQRIKELIKQLGDDSFQKREAATFAIKAEGRAYVDLIRKATEHPDAEIRARAELILKSWTNVQGSTSVASLQAALKKYLEQVKGVASQRELARRTVTAVTLKLYETGRKRIIEENFQAITRWRIDEVHNELLVLLESEDLEPAFYAMRLISGRTGNSYVARIHIGALQSGRAELVRRGLRSLPCPVWDRKMRPVIRETYAKIFEGKHEAGDFRDDYQFMRLSAFVASRDFGLVKAREYLLEKMASDDPKIALDAIRSLDDTYYNRRPVYPELIKALTPHFASTDPKLRAAAMSAVGCYKGEAVAPILLKGFLDTDKKVWQTAGMRLAQQHTYYPKGQSPIADLLRESIEKSTDEAIQSRHKFLLSMVAKNTSSGSIRWPEDKP